MTNARPSPPVSESPAPPPADTPALPPPPQPSPPPAGRLGRLRRATPRLLLLLLFLALLGTGLSLVGARLWAEHHLQGAASAAERFHNHEAQRHLVAAMSVVPDNARALLLAARVARRLQAFDQSAEFLDRLQRRHGDPAVVARERALLTAARGDVDQVANYWREHMEKAHPETPLVLEAVAAGLLRSYRLKEAERVLNRWDAVSPDSAPARLFRGLLADYRGQNAEAVAAFREALRLDPELDEARLRMADVLLEMGNAREATPHLQYLRGRMPENLAVLVALGRAHDALGEQAEAEQVLDAVLARDPNYPAALRERARLAVRAGEADRAVELLERAVRGEAGDFQANFLLARVLRESGQVDRAKEVEARGQQIETDLHRIQEIVTRDMQKNPNNPDLHFEAGMISVRAGNLKEGLRWLHSAVRLDPTHVKANEALAGYYQTMGEAGLAAKHRRQAQEGAAAAPPPAPAAPKK